VVTRGIDLWLWHQDAPAVVVPKNGCFIVKRTLLPPPELQWHQFTGRIARSYRMQKCSLLSRYARNHLGKKANGKIAQFFAGPLISGAVVPCVKRLTVECYQLGKQGIRATALGPGDTPSWSFTSCALRVLVGMEIIHALKLFHPADRIIDTVVDHPLVVRPVLLSHFPQADNPATVPVLDEFVAFKPCAL
jgi:hypothetical protein